MGCRKKSETKKDLLKIDIDRGDAKGDFSDWSPRSREELLAWDLAAALDDEKGLPFYIFCAKRYPEAFLRAVLGRVMEIPENRIKKSRGALFNYIVQSHKIR